MRRWGQLFPPRDKSRKPLPVSNDWVTRATQKRPGGSKVSRAVARPRLVHEMPEGTAGPAGQSRGQGPGCIFESRYKSVAILDEESLLTVGVYIDLNPVAAGISAVPETSEYTSISTRVEHVEAQGQTDRLEAAMQGSVTGSLAAGGLEESLWLCPIEDRRQIDSSREGMFDGLSLGNYLLVVDDTARLFRTGKARISAELAGVFGRLGSRADNWRLRMEKLRRGRLFGRFLAASREKLQKVAAHLGYGESPTWRAVQRADLASTRESIMSSTRTVRRAWSFR